MKYPIILFISGGMPNNLFSTTGGLYNQGIIGCIIQLRGATVTQDYQLVELQNAALSGFGVDTC